MNFRSDNQAPVVPEIMTAIAAVNHGFAPAYGDDETTSRLDKLFGDLFEHEVKVFPVITGTAANALALSALATGVGAVFCHEDSHIDVDECGAPELFSGGAKLFGLPGAAGCIDLDALRRSVGRLRVGNQHQVQPAAVSLTQATEWGTVYTPREIADVAAVARAHGMKLHMDGARFANAVAHLAVTPAEMTWKAGVDVLSFGATKNGAMAAEAVIFFDRQLAEDFRFRRKRGGHLLSKLRYVSAQLVAYVQDGLWLRLARHANAQAKRLADGLAKVDRLQLAVQPQVNAVFVVVDHADATALAATGAQFHIWPFGETAAGQVMIRLVTSFATTPEEIDEFVRRSGDILGRR